MYFGQPARITVESYKDRAFTGKVTKISPMGVEKDNVTTFEVRVSISNESRKLMAANDGQCRDRAGRAQGSARHS